MYWEYPQLVIDRSHLRRGGTSRIDIKDDDPEKLCKTIRSVAAVLNPPEAIWYVLPANPFRSGAKSKKRTE